MYTYIHGFTVQLYTNILFNTLHHDHAAVCAKAGYCVRVNEEDTAVLFEPRSISESSCLPAYQEYLHARQQHTKMGVFVPFVRSS
jgi:hypothetical protein